MNCPPSVLSQYLIPRWDKMKLSTRHLFLLIQLDSSFTFHFFFICSLVPDEPHRWFPFSLSVSNDSLWMFFHLYLRVYASGVFLSVPSLVSLLVPALWPSFLLSLHHTDRLFTDQKVLLMISFICSLSGLYFLHWPPAAFLWNSPVLSRLLVSRFLLQHSRCWFSLEFGCFVCFA